MAKAGPSKPAKRTRAEKKAARAAKWQSRRETWRAVGQAFNLTRKNDPRFIPYLVILGVGAAAVVYVVSYFVTGSLWYGIPIAVAAGLIAAMLTFSRRAQKSMYSQAEGTPGAAVWVLQNQLRGDWHTTPSVAGTAQLDAVHRVVGRPGVVLVGEGAPHRVRGLIAQEKKKVARAAPDTPIYDVVVEPARRRCRARRTRALSVQVAAQPHQGSGRRARKPASGAQFRTPATAPGTDADRRKDAQRPADGASPLLTYDGAPKDLPRRAVRAAALGFRFRGRHRSSDRRVPRRLSGLGPGCGRRGHDLRKA